MARTSSNPLARFHALWTLEGLGALDGALVRQAMEDRNPRMRIQAIRASETLYKAGDRSFAADYARLTKDADTNVVLQAMMTANTLKLSNAPALLKDAMGANKARGVQLVANAILNPASNAGRGGGGGRGGPPPFTTEEQAVMARGDTIYKELCFSCHGDDGRGTPQPGAAAGVLMAPGLSGAPRVQGHRDFVIKTLLHGLDGPIDGKVYGAGVMVPMGTNRDEWIASIASYVRNSFGNRGSFITSADVARVRAGSSGRTTTWKIDELVASLPSALAPQPEWKATASHNAAAAANAFTFLTWNTGTPQQQGMWYQVELPNAVRLTEIQFESTAAGGRGGGGGRGAAARGQAPPGAPAPGAAPPAEPPAGGPPPGFGAPPAPAMLGYPRGYTVTVSMDGTTWSAPVATGEGAGQTTVISFAPVQAKFVRITQTATVDAAPPWSIQRLRLFESIAR
jgi:mono/diheme cytochrome c family protein